MENQKFIILAIHSEERALSLKKLLEIHDIEVNLEHLFIPGLEKPAGFKIEIPEKDIPQAIRLTESIENFGLPNFSTLLNKNIPTVLIPVDFKPYSLKACKTGFEIAKRLGLSPVVLHCYPAPYLNYPVNYDESFFGNEGEELNNEIAEMEIGKDLAHDSEVRLDDLRKQIIEAQKRGEIPDIPFSTLSEEGIAEDVIRDYCRITPPSIIVMATRSQQKKNDELMGSVTVEVMDSCKVPVFSIPEEGELGKLKDIKKIVFLCNLEQQDLITLDSMMRMFDYPEVDVTLVPISEKSVKNQREKIKTLCDYFNRTFPEAHFSVQIFPIKDFMADFNNFERQAGIEMILISNKRRNIFARLFNPGIAHKLLFERDLPLLAYPYNRY